jgi:hypothetical protein
MRAHAVRGLIGAVALLLVSGGRAEGQTSIGPMVGANYSTIGGADASADLRSKVGLLVGAYAQVALSSRVGIEPQVHYARKGAKFVSVRDASYELGYLQIPMLARARFPGESSATAYLILGPSLAFRTSCTYSSEPAPIDCDDLVNESDEEITFARTDVSLIGGAGLELPNSLSIAVRYDFGITRLVSGAGVAGEGRFYNRALSVTLGYGIRLSAVR